MCRFLCICLLFAGLMGFFCSPILLCQVSSRMGEGCMFATCCQGALIGLRIKLRTQQNIQVNQCAMMLFTHSVNFPCYPITAICFQFLESLQFFFVCLVKDSNSMPTNWSSFICVFRVPCAMIIVWDLVAGPVCCASCHVSWTDAK